MIRKKIGLAVVGVLVGLGASLGAVAPAQAVPSGCSASSSGRTVTAYCYTSAAGTYFRAVAQCYYVTPTGSYDYASWYGAWQVQGDPLSSTATCGTGWGLLKAEAQTA